MQDAKVVIQQLEAMLDAHTDMLLDALSRDLRYVHSSGVSNTCASYLSGVSQGVRQHKEIRPLIKR